MEAALASRIIRSEKLSRELFQWLAAPDQFAQCDVAHTDDSLTASMNDVLEPMLADAPQWEKREARHAAPWLGAVCREIAGHYQEMHLGVGPRLLAASILPLYRSLATGQLSEGLRESRLRLSETLTLLGLCHEVGSELVQLIDQLNRRMHAPNLILSTQFDLDLVMVAQIVREQWANFDTERLQFNSQATGELSRFDRQQSNSKIADWAAPELLWKLAGELISPNSELVLPRAWVETPVPWNSIADHWHKLSLALSGPTAPRKVPLLGCLDSDATDTHATDNQGAHRASIDRDGAPIRDEAKAQAAIAELTELLETTSHADERDTEKRDIAPVKESDKPIATPAATVVIPKILLAEIRTHNDPVFVNVIRRQIAKCRSEDRAVSLVSMVVLPEYDRDHHAVHENGLTLWQQRLVNWLADHPHVVEPYAFLTSEGELLLCVLDLERNETTSLVRHGLVEVLTGKRVDETQSSLLAKVNIPARYHAGIASTSSPGAGFTAEQLIEPAVRCLSAASRHGKASIKSIEVY